jgi:hypothetical protein
MADQTTALMVSVIQQRERAARLERVALAIHQARFTRVGREPEPMDASDRDYCMALARAAMDAADAE